MRVESENRGRFNHKGRLFLNIIMTEALIMTALFLFAMTTMPMGMDG